MQTGRKGSYTRGMLVMAASSVAFSAGSLLVPLTRGVDTSIVASARFVIGALAILGMGALRLVRIKPVNWLWLMGRGLFGAASVYLMYYGIVRLGLGTGTILGYTYPIFAALLAPFMIGERLHGDVLAAVVVSFLGIWLVLSPVAPWDLVRGIGAAGAAGAGGGAAARPAVHWDAVLALLGGVCTAVAVVAVRKLQKTDSSYVIYLAQCVFGIALFGYPTAVSSFSFAPRIWLVLLGIGALATVAQLLMTEAYRDVPATEGSLLGFLVPVINSAFGVLVFGETMRAGTLAGGLLVLLACVYVGLRERLFRPRSSPPRIS